MSKMYQLSFSILQKVMLVLGLHWLITALIYLGILSPIALFAILALLFLIYRYYWRQTKSFYSKLIQHKLAIMLAVLIVQVIFLLSAELLIRRDAAVVFMGAFRYMKESSISSYLTRNPNNMFLFLYERFFFNLLGGAALWVMQALNIFYTNVTAYILYKGMQRFAHQRAADMVFALYASLACLSPYFYSMYTDMMPLPLIALQIFLAIDLFALKDRRQVVKKSLYLGILTGLTVIIRPPALILLIACFGLLFLKQNWRKFFLSLAVFSLSFAAVYGLANHQIKNQTEVPLVKGEGLAKGPLLFINLGLTYNGHNQEDMKEGLLRYIDEDKRDDYNNGMFASENVKKEIARRLKEYSLTDFLGHLYYKHSLTVSEGTLGWLYRDVQNEKTPYTSPLYAYTKDNPFAGFVRRFFLSTDKKEYRFYEMVKQIIWIAMSLGLVFAVWRYRANDAVNFLSLAVFGGLLFLLIFEGGKTRYLIQFLPQILALSALGLTDFQPKWLQEQKKQSRKDCP